MVRTPRTVREPGPDVRTSLAKVCETLAALVDRLDSTESQTARCIPWSSPVPVFGDWNLADVATLGINPSNREFVDAFGNELDEAERRFHTLSSLGLRDWGDADVRHLERISEACRGYFTRNPYDRWFKRLEYVISGVDASFYGGANGACHFDFIPFATEAKWGTLSTHEQNLLLTASGDTLGKMIRNSRAQILVLNGAAVVRMFERFAGTHLEVEEIEDWSLARKNGHPVRGIAYTGVVESLTDIDLGFERLVLGFNHNLQSSFGVSNRHYLAIRDWVASKVQEFLG